MLKIWQDFIERKTFSYFLVILMIIAGFFSLNALPKESAPDVQIPIAIINTPFSGATALEVSEQVSTEIEDAVDGITGIKEVKSTSSDGFSSVVVQFKQGENIDEKINEVKKEIDKIKSSLPADARDYTVHDIKFADQPIFSFTIASNENKFSLKNTAESVKEILKNIPGTSKVSYSGLPESQISIELDPKKIQKYKLSLFEIKSAIESANILSPLGKISIKNQDYTLSLNTKVKTVSDLENIPLSARRNNVVYLKNVAKISETFAEKDVFTEIRFPENKKNTSAIVFYISKDNGYNILKLTDDIKSKLVEISKNGEILDGLKYKITLNLGADARKDMTDLSKNGLASVLLVFIILIFVLGVKDAFVAAIGIPISFLLAFIFFKIVGNTLNFISLFSMILSIGILVDSDIVITEGIASWKKKIKKKNPKMSGAELEKAAAKSAVVNLAGPMLAGTITTIAVFAPLFFLSGVTGDFIKGIPFTVVFILIASQVVSIFVVPLLHSSHFKFPFANFWKKVFKIKDKKTTEKTEKKSKIKKFDFVKSKAKYKKVLNYFFAKKKRENIFIIIVILSFLASLILPISGILKSQFFPGGDVPFIYANVELEKDATKTETRDFLKNLQEQINDEKFYSSMVITSGRTSEFAKNGQDWGDNFGNILINIKEDQKEIGKTHMITLREKVKKAGFLEKNVEISAPEGGPPSGAPIEFSIISETFSEAKKGALLAEEILKNNSDILNIKSELDKNNTAFEVQIDRSKAALLGVSIPAVASEIFATTTGLEIFELKNEGKSTKTYLKIKRNEKEKNLREINPDTIGSMKVKNNFGKYIYISSFAKVVPKSTNSEITHLDGKISLKITAENKEETELKSIVEKIKKDFEQKNDSKSKLFFGGAFAEQEKSFGETAAAFAGGVALIFAVLIFLFNSLRLPLIIESVIPLAFSGVVVGLTLSGNMLSFPAILGFIALSGIVVNNSIILIYVYEEKRKKLLAENGKISKEELTEIVVSGSLSRLRPIIMTTITTIIGVVPLIFSSAIWAPIAYAIISGLLFATIITLIFIPILYKKFYPKK